MYYSPIQTFMNAIHTLSFEIEVKWLYIARCFVSNDSFLNGTEPLSVFLFYFVQQQNVGIL